MEPVKKSFNLSSDLAQRIDDYVRSNPGVSFTLIMNQALLQWLKDPKVTLKGTKMTEDDVKRFMEENRDLMDDLSK